MQYPRSGILFRSRVNQGERKMNTAKTTINKIKSGHCPLCGGLCSERVVYPCSKCQRRNPAAAVKWLASNSAR